MSDDDPEVRADIALRARTERERGKGGKPVAWSPPDSSWPCGSCGERAPCSGDIVAKLKQLREPDRAKIFLCGPCSAKRREQEAKDNRDRADRMARFIRELRDGRPKPEREQEIIRHLTALGHPDVNGLIAAIAARRDAKANKAPRRDS